jgi:ubiquinone/menaquinone biosynthesis C-methylase UbiE
MDLADSIRAYDAPERVSAYDRDMDLMHPLRHKMAAVILEVLPFPAGAPLRFLDLGSGTGFLTDRILKAWPNASVIAIDGAASMTELARARLGDAARRARFVVADFRSLATDLIAAGSLLKNIDWLVSSRNRTGMFVSDSYCFRYSRSVRAKTFQSRCRVPSPWT